MRIPFTKMHGLGNDFMIIESIRQPINFTTQDIINWGRRDTGVGFDQCLLIEPNNNAEIDFIYRIFNANGTEVGQCGNGARCIALFVYKKKLINKKIIRVATKTTNLTLTIHDEHTVSVDMGAVLWLQPSTSIQLADGKQYYLHTLNIGNPHAILCVDNIQDSPVATLGKMISEHTMFPEQTNVEFMQLINPQQIKLRVYERGCGETLACGSGAVAAVAAGQKFHGLSDSVNVILPGGELIVDRDIHTQHMCLTGPATFVYDGFLY